MIELLVVISIIALLIGILLPTLSAARDTGRSIKSASNMRQIGTAIHVFAEEHDGAIPEGRHAAGATSYIDTLAPYVENVDEIRLDPAEPRDRQAILDGGTSYPLNDYLGVAAFDPFGQPIAGSHYGNLHTLRQPTDTYVAFLASQGMGVGLSGDHVHARSTWLNGWSSVTGNISPGRYGGRDDDATSGSSPYLYADAHVEIEAGQSFKQRYEDLTADGINIAQPPE